MTSVENKPAKSIGHTPLPWRGIQAIDEDHYHAITSDAPGCADIRIGWINNFGDEQSLADLALIIRAVNSHADLLAACEAAAKFLAANQVVLEYRETHPVRTQLRAAIAKAQVNP